MTVQILVGDCRKELAGMAAESVHCVVTSPPYWGLRDYGVDGQLGMEATPDEYVETMVGVFREVWRVLRKDGTVWLNIGDCYAGAGPSGASYQSKTARARQGKTRDGKFAISKTLGERGLTYAQKKPIAPPGLKSKDLVMMPARLALALQADGWWIRSDIIWAKPNPMPESVTDRPTSAHEHVFLLTKSARYFYDAEAVRIPPAESQVGRVRDDVIGGAAWQERGQHSAGGQFKTARGVTPRHEGHTNHTKLDETARGQGANLRNVWTIATQPYAQAHFATFPVKLVEPCIKAGCPKDGTVLDPFGGSGTVGLVAERLGRDAILIELNEGYAAMARARIRADLGTVETDLTETHDAGPLFDAVER